VLEIQRERRRSIQRYRCQACDYSFSLREAERSRISNQFRYDVVRRHVEGRESYRVIARGVFERTGRKISPSSLQRMVDEIATGCKTAWEMSRELRPRWKGYLLLDEKMCSVRGEQFWLYVGIDSTGDIIHCRHVRELTVTEAEAFVREIVEDLGYPLVGITTDMDAALCQAVQHVCEGKPHQYCLKHALAAIEKLLELRPFASRQLSNQGYLRHEFRRLRDRRGVWLHRAHEEFVSQYQASRRVSQSYRDRQELRDWSHEILFAENEERACERFAALRRSRQHPVALRRAVVAFFNRHWHHLIEHHHTPGLPRTTNLIENVNKQLERRFKTIEAFQHRASAASYINLLVAYLRLKPYTDCRGKRKHLNGHSRLHAAGVNTTNLDWITMSLKHPKNGNR